MGSKLTWNIIQGGAFERLLQVVEVGLYSNIAFSRTFYPASSRMSLYVDLMGRHQIDYLLIYTIPAFPIFPENI